MLYLNMVSTSIFHCFFTPLGHQNLSSHVGESQILQFRTLLFPDYYEAPFWIPKNIQNRAQEVPTSSPKRASKKHAFMDPILGPTWPQLGPMLASKIDQKSILKVWAPPKAPLGPLRIDTEANLAPTWPNLDPTWFQNDPNMAPT